MTVPREILRNEPATRSLLGKCGLLLLTDADKDSLPIRSTQEVFVIVGGYNNLTLSFKDI